jgi:hypothetical protein
MAMAASAHTEAKIEVTCAKPVSEEIVGPVVPPGMAGSGADHQNNCRSRRKLDHDFEQEVKTAGYVVVCAHPCAFVSPLAG